MEPLDKHRSGSEAARLTWLRRTLQLRKAAWRDSLQLRSPDWSGRVGTRERESASQRAKALLDVSEPIVDQPEVLMRGESGTIRPGGIEREPRLGDRFSA